MKNIELQDIDLKELIEKETGEKFNRENKIYCPFHKEKTPSLSIRFNSNTKKEQFKCFGCGVSGDAIDFIKALKNIDYTGAKEYLGLSTEKSIHEQLEDKVRVFIEWQIRECEFRKGYKLLGIFQFVDSKNNTLYFKAKFLNPEGIKEMSYYHIENDKVVNKRGCEEVPYNLHRTLQAIEDNRTIIICEGEKDVNKINHLFKGHEYEATSVKSVTDLSILEGAKIYVCGDTGAVGEQYKWKIHKFLFSTSKVFKFINLPGINKLGDNKDVTDWLESGHDKRDLLNAFERSLDLKSKFELQQDTKGIYKYVHDKKEDDYKKVYITNFKIVEASSIDYMDSDIQGIKIMCRSSTGKIFEKTGIVSVFDDVKSFRNFLGSMELTYESDLKDLIILKKWINKYFIYDNFQIYDNPKFIYIDNELSLITNKGIMYSNRIAKNGQSEGNFKLDLIEIEPIKKEELNELMKYLFCFSTLSRSYSIIGTIVNNLAVAQASKSKVKFHHLLIVGESGSGKTTIMTNVVAPILNYPIKDIKSIGLITPFALIKELSNGNYTMLFDEFKPSSLDRYKIAKLSETLRNLYDRAAVSRGDKTFEIKNFQLNRPIIIAGEESYPNQEKALIERSCIVYLSKFERTEEQTKAMEQLKEHEILLNKLGRSIVDIILRLSVDEYSHIRKSISQEINDLKDRPLNTAINICTGIEILNILLKGFGFPVVKDYVDEIVNNISIEILEEGEETHSIVEQMLILYNDMIEDGRVLKHQYENVIKNRGDGIFIRTSEMINQIHEHVKNVNSDITPLGIKDFKKQAQKSGILTKPSGKQIKVDDKNVKFDIYNSSKLRKLKVDAIISPELEDVTEIEGNVIPFV